MKKIISIKTISISLAALFFLSGSIYAAAKEYGNMSETYQEGLKMKEIFSDTSKDQIVAEINGIPISMSQVEFKRYINSANIEYYENSSKALSGQMSNDYLNDYPLDDMAILNQIAKERFLLESAKANGINISYDDIMKEIIEEEEYVEREVARGNEFMIQRQKEDEEFLEALGMTKEEYNNEIYADMLLYNKTFIEYGKYYYTNNPNCSMRFEEYIDQQFDNADVMIVKYNDVENE
ncbi:MAG: SurA N-terminal domain-containing protein [Ruminococcus flavefaciens]|nr:SurA N-terminal domain-containing protein [Ruminococcus flavefaciens]